MNVKDMPVMEKLRRRICINCDHSNKDHGHYVPPSIGEKGFFACHAVCKECRE